MPGFSEASNDDELVNDFKKILNVKVVQNTKDLCFGNTLDFLKFKREVFGYRFKDKPDYALLKQMLVNLMEVNTKADKSSLGSGDEIGADVEHRTLIP